MVRWGGAGFLVPLIAGALALLPHFSGFRAEEGNAEPTVDFAFSHTEGYVEVWLDAPDGTTPYVFGETKTTRATVSRRTWEIWVHPESQAREIRNDQAVAIPNVGVNFAVVSGDGFLSSTLASTDGSGLATTAFTSGAAASTVTATVSIDGADVIGSLDFTAPSVVEEWYYAHSEGTLEATLTTSGMLSEVPPGETRPLQLEVRYVTWDIYHSNLGGTEARNYASAPASGAGVSWTWEGAGYTTGDTSIDSSGFAYAQATIGHGGTRVTASINYAVGAGSRSAAATLDFSALAEDPAFSSPGADPVPDSASTTPTEPNDPNASPTSEPPVDPAPPTTPLTILRSESEEKVTNLSADGSLTDLPPGSQRTIAGYLQRDVWDVWGSGYGDEDRRYSFTSSAPGVVLTLVPTGDANIGTPQIITGSAGEFSATFAVGSQPGAIQLAGPNGEILSTIDYTVSTTSSGEPVPVPDPASAWTYDRTETYDNIADLTLSGPTYELAPGTERVISGRVKRYSCNVFRDANGAEDRRDFAETNVASAHVAASIENGNGTLSHSAIFAGGDGTFSVTFTMGSSASGVRLTLPQDAQQWNTVLAFTPPPEPEEVFTYDHTERIIEVSVSSSGAGAVYGQPVDITVQALETSWEVWVGDQGGVDLRNDYHGPAINVPVTLGMPSGLGTFSTSSGFTDVTGTLQASGTFWSWTAQVRADVSYEGVFAFGTLNLDVSPPPSEPEPTPPPSEPTPPPSEPTPPPSEPTPPPSEPTPPPSEPTPPPSEPTPPPSEPTPPPSEPTPPPSEPTPPPSDPTPPPPELSRVSSVSSFRVAANAVSGVLSVTLSTEVTELWSSGTSGDPAYVEEWRSYTSPASGAIVTLELLEGEGAIGAPSGPSNDRGIVTASYTVTTSGLVRVNAFFGGQYNLHDVWVGTPSWTPAPGAGQPPGGGAGAPPITPPLVGGGTGDPGNTNPWLQLPTESTSIVVRSRAIVAGVDLFGEWPWNHTYGGYSVRSYWTDAPEPLELYNPAIVDDWNFLNQNNYWNKWVESGYSPYFIYTWLVHSGAVTPEMRFPITRAEHDETWFSAISDDWSEAYSGTFEGWKSLHWSEYWLERVETATGAPAGTDEAFQQTFIIEVWERATKDGVPVRYTATATFRIDPMRSLSSKPMLAGDAQALAKIDREAQNVLRLAPPEGTYCHVDVSPLTWAFKAQNGKINDGFDPPLTGDEDIHGVRDEDDWVSWTRVIASSTGGLARPNELIEFITNSPGDVELFVPEDSQDLLDVEPKVITQQTTAITIRTTGAALDRIVKKRIIARPRGSSSENGLELRVYVLPGLDDPVKLRFYIADDPITPACDVQTPLGQVAERILDECARRFAQAGIGFRVDSAGEIIQGSFAALESASSDGPFDEPGHVTPTWKFDLAKGSGFLSIRPLGGDIPILLTHKIKDDAAQFWVEHSLVLLDIDAWSRWEQNWPVPPGDSQRHLSGPYPYDEAYGFNQDEAALVDDSLGRCASFGRVAAHEIGHRLLIQAISQKRGGKVIGNPPRLRDERPWRGVMIRDRSPKELPI